MRAQFAGAAGGPVFASLAGKRSSDLSNEFKHIMRRAGIQGEMIQYRNGKASRSVRSLSFHSFCSALANAGTESTVRQSLSGHSSAAVHNKYSHISIETKREAIAKLG